MWCLPAAKLRRQQTPRAISTSNTHDNDLDRT
jgi:hypothetical protein